MKLFVDSEWVNDRVSYRFRSLPFGSSSKALSFSPDPLHWWSDAKGSSSMLSVRFTMSPTLVSLFHLIAPMDSDLRP